MKHTLIAGLLAAAATIPMGVATASAAPATRGGSPTIAQVLLSDSSSDAANGFDRRWFDYDIATQAVLLFPDLVAAASDANASLTVFLPNDLAFRNLVRDLTGTWPRTEQETFDAVAGLGLDTVKAVLTYHIVGAELSPLALLRSNGQQESTLNGATFTVKVRAIFIRLQDNDPDAGDPYVVQPSVGGRLANGYVHGISAVLRPADL
jgi:uncharacterized surface protein with fasciclin (FAS1) repeats